jgi:hypothetical protein
LSGLESALYGGRKLEETGWKTIAPAGLTDGPIDLPQLAKGPGATIITNGALLGALGPGSVRVVVRRGGTNGAATSDMQDGPHFVGPGGMPPGAMVTATEDAVVMAPGTNQAGGKGVTAHRQSGPAVVRVVRKRADGGTGSVEEEVWSPVEIVLESRLASQLGDFSGAPTAEAAAEAAKQVNGHVKVYYALRKSALGMGLAGMSLNFGGPGARNLATVLGPGAAGTNAAKQFVNAGPSSEELEAAMRRHRLDELGKLTPEQRVQRAREKQGLSQP